MKDKRTKEERREYKKKYHIEHKEQDKKYRDENKEHSREVAREYYKKNVEKFKEKKRDYYRRNKRKVIEGRKKYNREHRKEILDYNRKRKYGLDNVKYDIILKKQNGVCAICLKPETYKHQSGKIKELAVDHNHKTGEVRGLLCSRCNITLGLVDDNLEILNVAIDYLKSFKNK